MLCNTLYIEMYASDGRPLPDVRIEITPYGRALYRTDQGIIVPATHRQTTDEYGTTSVELIPSIVLKPESHCQLKIDSDLRYTLEMPDTDACLEYLELTEDWN